MQRQSLALVLALLTLLPLAAHAQTEPPAPIVKSAKIIDALSSKDVVLDQPGHAVARQRPARSSVIDLQVQFGFNSADLTPHGQRQLDELANALSSKALMRSGFSLAGHTDRVGEHDYNMRLSLDRANAVRHYLQLTHGLAPQRLQTAGYGFTRLKDKAHPTSPINRRVEVRRIVVPGPQSAHPAEASGHGAIVVTPR